MFVLFVVSMFFLSLESKCLDQNLAMMNFDGSMIYAIHLHYIFYGAQHI
jgi:hypothetical protein